jgi:hypothetical protein
MLTLLLRFALSDYNIPVNLVGGLGIRAIAIPNNDPKTLKEN